MKILLLNVHTAYLRSLAQTGHEIYCIEGVPGAIEWQYWVDQGKPRPQNLKSIAYKELDSISCDVLILQTPAQWIERELLPALPTIHIEHNAQPHLVPHYVADKGVVVVFNSLRTAISFTQRPGVTYRIIESGLPDDLSPYEGEEAVVLTVCNRFKERELWTRFSLWQRLVMGLPWKVIGYDNQGIGEVAANWDSLRDEYARARVYLSVGVAFPGFADMEAAMTGMPVVRVKGAGELVKARALLKHYLDDKEDAAAQGQKWREWALEHHNIERFCSEWNEVLDLVRSQ